MIIKIINMLVQVRENGEDGDDGYLYKPFEIDELLNIARKRMD